MPNNESRNHYIKLNYGKVSQDYPPYNELYDAHAPFFEAILEIRKSTVSKSFIYVPITDTEKEIDDLIESRVPTLCILSGLVGIGKSTFAEHIVGKYSVLNEFEVLKFDLNKNDIDFEITGDIESNISKAVREYLANNILSKVKIDSMNDFYDFINSEITSIFASKIFGISTSEEKLAALKKINEEDPIDFSYAALKYYMYKKNKSRIILIIDNCDLKYYQVVEEFIQKLGYLERSFEGHENISLGPAFCIITCRPEIKVRLVNEKSRNILGSHGYKIVEINRPCSLAALISERFSKHKEIYGGSDADNDMKIVTAKGYRITIDKRDEALRKIVEVFDKTDLGDMILKLCNMDVSETLNNTLKIIRNRHFFNLEDFIPSFIQDDFKNPKYGIKKSKVLNALAYGNAISEDRSFYPVEETILPNIFCWDPRRNDFLLKIRIMQILLYEGATIMGGNCGIPIRQIFILIREIGLYNDSISESLMFDSVKDMYVKGLIFTHNFVSPANTEELIILTPRSEILFELMKEFSSLIEYYIEDTPIDSTLFTDTLRVRCGLENIGLRLDKVFAFLEFVIRNEKIQLEKAQIHLRRNSFYCIYNEILVSRIIFEGIANSYKAFYRHEISYAELGKYDDMLEKYNKKIESLLEILGEITQRPDNPL